MSRHPLRPTSTMAADAGPGGEVDVEPLLDGEQPGSRCVGAITLRSGLKSVIATVALVAAIVALASAGVQGRYSEIRNVSSRLRKVLRLSENICLGSQLSMNFGNGLTKFDLDDGSGTIERSCPFGASNPNGKIHFECLPSGMWNLTQQDCYDCPELREKFTYVKGETRDIILKPAAHGDVYHEECAFFDGEKHHRYKKGRLSFACHEKRWQHIGTTCSDTNCREGHVTLDFYGKVGKVHYHVPGADHIAHMPCPNKCPNPDGHVRLKCGDIPGGKQVGTYSFLSQSCQACNPTNLTLTLEKVHKRSVDLPAAGLHAEEERHCVFDDGAKVYAQGKVLYKCFDGGWKLWKTTCRDWICPDQTAVMKMEYTVGGQAMTGQSRIHLKAAMNGTHEYPCPEGALDPDGTVSFDCLKDKTWRINTVNCGNGIQVHEAAIGFHH